MTMASGLCVGFIITFLRLLHYWCNAQPSCTCLWTTACSSFRNTTYIHTYHGSVSL